MKSEKSTASGGIGFTGLLLIAFIILKLVGVINWSWWWVLSPLWISIVVVIILAVIPFVIAWIFQRRIK